jgi:hypothetical protein
MGWERLTGSGSDKSPDNVELPTGYCAACGCYGYVMTVPGTDIRLCGKCEAIMRERYPELFYEEQ